MEEYVINNVEEFVSHLIVLPEFDFFRGVSNITHKLIPSIGRIFENERVMLQFEKEIFQDFKRKYSLYETIRPMTDYEYLFLAQHHGLPTRLLDWTYNPLVALYFAVEKDFDVNGCVYQAAPTRILTLDDKLNIFEVEENFIIIPNLTHIRYKNQNGLFMLYSSPNQEHLTGVMSRFIIPSDKKKGILGKLRKLGITRSLLFPSLDSQAYDILEIYKERYISHISNENQVPLKYVPRKLNFYKENNLEFQEEDINYIIKEVNIMYRIENVSFEIKSFFIKVSLNPNLGFNETDYELLREKMKAKDIMLSRNFFYETT